MALLLVRGTQLESRPAKVPLNKTFIFALGSLYLLAVHLPWPVFSLVDRSTNIAMPTNLITWMSVSLVMCVGLIQIIRHRYIRYSKLTIGLLLCCLLMTLPLIYSSPKTDEVTPRLIGLWGGLLLFVLLQQFMFSSRHKQRIIWFIVLAGWIEAVKNYVLFIYPPLTGLSNALLTANTATTFYSSQSIATFLATAATASGYLLSRHPSKYGQLSIVSLLYATPATMLPMIYIYSPIVATGTTILSSAMIIPYLYRFASMKRLIGWCASFGAGVMVCLTIYTLTPTKIHNPEWQQYTSFKISIQQAGNMLIEKPFTGYGYGKFDEEYVIYNARQHQLNASFPPALPEHVHPQNEPLFWSVEGGLLPLLAITLAALMVITRVYSAKPGTRLASFALLLPIAIQAQFSAIFYLSSIHWVTFIILLFWVDQRVARYQSSPMSRWQGRIISLMSVLLPLSSILAIGGVLHDQQRLTQYRDTTESRLLRQLILPSLWQDELKEFSLVQALKNARLSDDDVDHSEMDVQWLLNKIRLHPRPYYYQLLIDMYNQMGDFSRAQQTKTEAHFLFPTVNFSTRSKNANEPSPERNSTP